MELVLIIINIKKSDPISLKSRINLQIYLNKLKKLQLQDLPRHNKSIQSKLILLYLTIRIHFITIR